MCERDRAAEPPLARPPLGGSDADAGNKTKTELGKLFPDVSKLTLEQRAALLDGFAASEGDDADLQRGKKAILDFFGLGS